MIVSRLEIQESDGPEVVREKWAAGFNRVFGPGPEGVRKAGVIARWLGFDLGDSPAGRPTAWVTTRSSCGTEPSTYTAECFQILAAENPVVVLLEDLHWADDGTLDWMDEADGYPEREPGVHRRHVAAHAVRAPPTLG